MHALQAEGGITHASRIAHEGAHGRLRDTVGPSWGWGNGWQESHGFDEGFNVALLEQLTLRFSPRLCFGRIGSKDRIGHLPHMFLCLPEIHNLHGRGKVFSDQIPDPWGSIPQDDDLLSMSHASLLGQGVEQRGKGLHTAPSSHVRFGTCRIDKDSRS